MATREIVEWVCDLCDQVVEVETHELVVDGRTVELEACEPCWAEPAAVFDKLAAVGRVAGRRKRRKGR